jgi:hypothetical protein
MRCHSLFFATYMKKTFSVFINSVIAVMVLVAAAPAAARVIVPANPAGLVITPGLWVVLAHVL